MSLVRERGLSVASFLKLLLMLFTVIASQLSYAGVWGEGKWGTMQWGVESGVSATASEIQVTETYIGLLDRAPDANGLAYWVSQLNRAVAAGQEATFAMKNWTLSTRGARPTRGGGTSTEVELGSGRGTCCEECCAERRRVARGLRGIAGVAGAVRSVRAVVATRGGGGVRRVELGSGTSALS